MNAKLLSVTAAVFLLAALLVTDSNFAFLDALEAYHLSVADLERLIGEPLNPVDQTQSN